MESINNSKMIRILRIFGFLFALVFVFTLVFAHSAKAAGTTGAVPENGTYVYYENGVKSAKTGLAKSTDGTGWYYMKSGTYDMTAEGICKRIDGVGGWFYVRDGKYRTDLTGIAKKVDRTGGWYYVKNGVYKTNVTGISKKIDGSGGWYYVKNGVYTTSATGIAKRADGVGGWYYVKNGVYKTNVTGIAKRADGVGGWYYVKNGVYNTNATGIAKKVDGTGGWYYVKNGVYKAGATGIARRADGVGGWYYVKNGVYNTSATGITKKADSSSDSRWFYVQSGVYKSTASGIAKKADGTGGWYYVRNGVYRPHESGIAKKADGSSSTWFYVKDGTYRTSFTGLARKADCSSDTQFYVKNGIYTKTDIASYSFGSGTYKIEKGIATLQSGYLDPWIQDWGYYFYQMDGYLHADWAFKIKNPNVDYAIQEFSMPIDFKSSSGEVLKTVSSTMHIHIAAGDTITVGTDLGYKIEAEVPSYAEYKIEYSDDIFVEQETLGIAKVSDFTFSETSRAYEEDTGRYRYSGYVTNNSDVSTHSFIGVIYYKNGQMLGGTGGLMLDIKVGKKVFFTGYLGYGPAGFDSYEFYVQLIPLVDGEVMY
ncbi:MAG: hypothetical protein K5637_09055 [Lachnospiraceae bacterium]|nr:hypothetical protein [Lachnospiraceae bacterium]